MPKTIEEKKENLEIALDKWIKETIQVEDKIRRLLDYNDVSRSEIAKEIDLMKNKFVTLQNNLKRY